MDRLLYVAMTGAKQTLDAQAANNHNLANATTTGFKADMAAFQTRNVAGAGFASRAYATASTTGWDSSAGSMQSSGKPLDIAIQGEGFIAVQAADGKEAYTRAGDLRIDVNGLLSTGAGHVVMGAGGPVTVPQYSSISIGGDGTVSIVPYGQEVTAVADIARIKLVNPKPETLERGGDGLFRVREGSPAAEADVNVRVTSGMLEGSNVNTIDAMVNMIELARHFDLQVKAMRSAEDNAAVSAQLLRMG